MSCIPERLLTHTTEILRRTYYGNKGDDIVNPDVYVFTNVCMRVLYLKV